MTPSRTLIVNEYSLILSPTLATEIGLNEALFLQQLHYWLGQSSHVRDGQTWVYNTLEQWNEQFPFWSYSTLRRTICSLREQGLIQTTDQYNRCATDRRLWYTINYEQLSASSPEPPATDDQPPTQDEQRHDVEMESSTAQDEQSSNVEMDTSAAQDEQLSDVEMDPSVAQDEPVEKFKMSSSLYGTETTNKDYNRDYAENTTTTPAQPDRACEEPVVVALTSHGLSRPIALGFAQEYSEEYLQEKIAFLEYELDRRPNLGNPAGWLRRAIEQDFSPPSGYQAAQQAAVQTEEWQVIIDEHNRQVEAHRQAEAEAEATRMDQDVAHIAKEAARFYPLHGTTETLVHAWKEGCKSMAETMSIGGFLDTLEQSILLSFADGHAKIGVKCQHAFQRLQLFGKHALRNALSFAMADRLQGQRASYELMLV